MAEISLGRLRIATEGNCLKVSTTARPEDPVVLEAAEVSELLSFLVSLTATDFNQRGTFRIPLWHAVKVDVTLFFNGQSVQASAVNLSMTGMLVDLLGDSAPDVQLDEFIEANVEFEGVSARIPVQVKRIEGLRWGLDLSNPSSDGESDPFPDYSSIVMTIQRRWASRFKKS